MRWRRARGRTARGPRPHARSPRRGSSAAPGAGRASAPAGARGRRARASRSARACRRRAWRERPAPVPAQVALDLALDHVRRLEPHDPRARVQVVGQPALEVLARLLAERRLAVGLDVDVDRSTSRVAAASAIAPTRRAGGDVPLVDEHVLGRGELEDRPRARAGRARRCAAWPVSPKSRTSRAAASGRGKPQRLTSSSTRRRMNAWRRRRGGAGRARGRGRRGPARRAGGRAPAEGLALAQDVLAALDHEPHRALDHLVALGLARVHVRLGQEAAARPTTSNSSSSRPCPAPSCGIRCGRRASRSRAWHVPSEWVSELARRHSSRTSGRNGSHELSCYLVILTNSREDG